MSQKSDDLNRLIELREEMFEKLEETTSLLRSLVRQGACSNFEFERAKAYWIGWIDRGLGGGSCIDTYDSTFEKTLDSLGRCQECDSFDCEHSLCQECDELFDACYCQAETIDSLENEDIVNEKEDG